MTRFLVKKMQTKSWGENPTTNHFHSEMQKEMSVWEREFWAAKYIAHLALPDILDEAIFTSRIDLT